MGSAPEAARDFLLPLPGIPTACGNGKWEVSQDLSELRSGRKMRTTGRPALAFHPFVRSAPSFRPDLRAARAGARSGGQGWPVFGPPRQRRAASLTAASTTACSIVSGLRSLHATNKPSKGVRERPSKKELMLSPRGPLAQDHHRYEHVAGDNQQIKSQKADNLSRRLMCVPAQLCDPHSILCEWLRAVQIDFSDRFRCTPAAQSRRISENLGIRRSPSGYKAYAIQASGYSPKPIRFATMVIRITHFCRRRICPRLI